MAGCLGWLGFADFKCAKKGDYSLILLSIMIYVFSTMERPGLDLWFNFFLLYPLAKVTSDGCQPPEGSDLVIKEGSHKTC